MQCGSWISQYISETFTTHLKLNISVSLILEQNFEKIANEAKRQGICHFGNEFELIIKTNSTVIALPYRGTRVRAV